jgi:hypothetical protein
MGNPQGKNSAGRVSTRETAAGEVSMPANLPGFISAHLIETVGEITAARVESDELVLGHGEAYLLRRTPTGSDWYSSQTGAEPETSRQPDGSGDDLKIRIWNYTLSAVQEGERQFACQTAWGDFMLVAGGGGSSQLLAKLAGDMIGSGTVDIEDVKHRSTGTSVSDPPTTAENFWSLAAPAGSTVLLTPQKIDDDTVYVIDMVQAVLMTPSTSLRADGFTLQRKKRQIAAFSAVDESDWETWANGEQC